MVAVTGKEDSVTKAPVCGPEDCVKEAACAPEEAVLPAPEKEPQGKCDKKTVSEEATFLETAKDYFTEFKDTPAKTHGITNRVRAAGEYVYQKSSSVKELNPEVADKDGGPEEAPVPEKPQVKCFNFKKTVGEEATFLDTADDCITNRVRAASDSQKSSSVFSKQKVEPVVKEPTLEAPDRVILEETNVVLREWGEKRLEPNLKKYWELCVLLNAVEFKKGVSFVPDVIPLCYGLISFGAMFLKKRGFKALQTCPFIRNTENLLGDGLITTSEQPLVTQNIIAGQFCSDDLPQRYAGISSWKEDSSTSRTMNDIQDISQFCIRSPDGNDSWEMFEEIITNSEDFYKELGLPYRVVSVMSSALTPAAAKEYALEAWFPASKTYRKLVSCENCKDYLARMFEIGYDQDKDEQSKKYVHMLNCTLTDSEKTICCILENYQREDGIEVPKALVPCMGGTDFLPFKKSLCGKQAACFKSESKSKVFDEQKDEPVVKELAPEVPDKDGSTPEVAEKHIAPEEAVQTALSAPEKHSSVFGKRKVEPVVKEPTPEVADKDGAPVVVDKPAAA